MTLFERTGERELDQLIAQFLAEDERAASMWNWEWSQGACDELSSSFYDFVGERFRCGIMPTTPDELGYIDREIAGSDDHVVNWIASPSGSVYVIDWTASQYGYQAVPLVLRKDTAGSWQRRW